jgi:hypothetical protein
VGALPLNLIPKPDNLLWSHLFGLKKTNKQTKKKLDGKGRAFSLSTSTRRNIDCFSFILFFLSFFFLSVFLPSFLPPSLPSFFAITIVSMFLSSLMTACPSLYRY